MSGNSLRLFLLVACLPLLAPLMGCFFATDLLNPQVLSAVGFDPATIIPPQGRVVIAFQNSTEYPADFFAVVSDNILDETAPRSVISASNVAANETRTLVVDCPVGDVLPTAVLVDVDGAVTQVDYAGAPLSSGSEFVCGDVIQMRVTQLAAGAFAIEVQILPGR
jgi:hypothetical protein